MNRDTIYAPATASGRAAVAVVRISGPESGETLSALAGTRPAPRRATLRKLHDAKGQLLDTALVLWFPGPDSHTGEDVAELHLHGGRAVVQGVLETLGELNLRLAEPGEFTRRAFEAGKLDLAQAEAVADLVDAETTAQRRQALAQLGGALTRNHERWRELLLQASALLEAAVDFPDEELPEAVGERAVPVLRTLERELEAATASAERGRRIRDGYRIALVGAPNAGKSTLLNALAGREAAIVTATPGTTRDVIEVPMVLAGYPVLLADTAGLRATADPIEAEGVRRARAWSEAADLRLWVIDATSGDSAAERDVAANDLLIVNKCDAVSVAPSPSREAVRISALNISDVDRLRRVLADRVVHDLSGAEFPSATRTRHAEALSGALTAIRAGLNILHVPELAAEEVRRAGFMLERITGRVEVEQVLGRVFATFCIGK